MAWREHLFLLTDIEGSTRLWEEHPTSMAAALALHDAVIEEVVTAHGGRMVKARGEGDATFNVFLDAAAAVDAAVVLQRRLATADWPDGIAELRVRMSVHGGPVQERAGDYHGPTVNRAARLRSAAHGGQVLVSGVVAGRLGARVQLRDHGHHHLADLNETEHIHEVVIDPMAEHEPLKTLDASPHNLPQGLDTLIGRDRELRQLKQTVRRHPVVTLVGPGGAGKTRLATELAALVTPEYRDGSLLIELAPIRTDVGVSDAILTALDTSTSGDGDPLDRLVRSLTDRHLLLVLDNCEHVLSAARATVARIVEDCTDVTVVATTQVGLRVPGEVVVPLDMLAIPDHDDVETVASAPASALFLARAAQADPRFTLDDDNAPHIASICRRVDGVPLALELAAARIRHAGPDEIVRQLDRRFRVLKGARDKVHRHQTMHNAIAWSHDLLDDHDRELLHLCGVFAGPFRMVDLERVVDHVGLDLDAWSGISELVDRSLVALRRDDGATRYRLLESVRDFVRAAASDDGTFTGHRDAHLDWIDELTAGPRADWVHTLDDQRLAVRHGLDEGDFPTAARVAPRMELILFHRGAIAEARTWMELVAERADELPVGDQVLCLGLLADECHLLEDRTAAEKWAAAAEIRLPDVTDLTARVRGGTLLGKLAARRGDIATAVRLWDRAIRDGEELGDTDLLVNPIGARTNHLLRNAQHDDARILVEPLRDRLARDSVGYSQTSWLLALAFVPTDLDRAAVLLEQALTNETVRQRPWVLAGAGMVASLRGYDGRSLADEGIVEARTRGDAGALIGALAARSTLDGSSEDDAANEARLGLRLLQWCSNGQEGIEGALLLLARAAARRGLPDEALLLLAAADTKAAPPLRDADRRLVLDQMPDTDEVSATIARRKGATTAADRLADLGERIVRTSF